MTTTYEWEWSTYGEFREVIIDRRTQTKLANHLVRHFKTKPVTVENSQRRGGAGKYFKTLWGGRIKMGKSNGTLGTLCHEFAHHLSRHRYGNEGGGHGKKFKHELKRVYTWAKRWLPNK